MSADVYPRQAIPDRILEISRCTNDLRHRMVPTIIVRLILLYVMTRAAIETGIRLHSYVFLPDRYKIVLTDHPKKPSVYRFIERMNRHLSRVLNALGGFPGYMWDAEPPKIVELLDRDAVLDAIISTLTSAQRAGLARHPGDWVGVESSIDQIGADSRPVKRPGRLGRGLPPSLDLKLIKPRFFEDLSLPEFRSLLRCRLRSSSTEIRRDRRSRGLRTRSRGAILGTPFHAGPRGHSDDDGLTEGDRSQFRGGPDLCREAEAALVAFQAAYRSARTQWAMGRHATVFPFGTYILRRDHGARMADAA